MWRERVGLEGRLLLLPKAPGCSLVVVSIHDALEFLAGLTVEIIGQVVEALYEPFHEGIVLWIPPEAGGQLLEHLTCQLEKLLILIKRGGGGAWAGAGATAGPETGWGASSTVSCPSWVGGLAGTGAVCCCCPTLVSSNSCLAAIL